MSKRIGLLTSGGDCQGLNAAIRAAAKALYEEYGKDIEIYGILDGYSGLINCEYKQMKPEDFSGILTLGGTILGTSRRPYKLMRVIEDDGIDKVKAMKDTYSKLKLDCLIILGGNGTHKTANLLCEEGLNVITLPKTIDNDIYGTDITFGFQSACDIATDVIDRIHSTAYSHKRVFIVEVMGHKVGWLNLYAGIAGGADVILIPEIPYNIDKIVQVIDKRIKNKKRFTIIAAAEGIKSEAESKMSKKEYKAYLSSLKNPSVAFRLSDELSKITQCETRPVVLGHFQRGGSPCSYDRILCTQLGMAAVKLIKEKKFGNMVGVQNGKFVPVPLKEVAGKLKKVPVDGELIRGLKDMGISFGN